MNIYVKVRNYAYRAKQLSLLYKILVGKLHYCISSEAPENAKSAAKRAAVESPSNHTPVTEYDNSKGVLQEELHVTADKERVKMLCHRRRIPQQQNGQAQGKQGSFCCRECYRCFIISYYSDLEPFSTPVCPRTIQNYSGYFFQRSHPNLKTHSLQDC